MRSAPFIIAVTVVALLCISCASPPRSTLLFEGTNQVTISYFEADPFLEFAGHPSVEASINGVSGRFIIDTGAPGPLLTMTAVRLCKIAVAPSASKGVDFLGKQYPLKVATNVTISLTPNFAIHWSKVVVSPDRSDHFGLLDYGSLRAAHAVMDMNQKTITFTR